MNKAQLIEKLRENQSQYKFGTPKYDAYGQAAFFASKLDEPNVLAQKVIDRLVKIKDDDLCRNCQLEISGIILNLMMMFTENGIKVRYE